MRTAIRVVLLTLALSSAVSAAPVRLERARYHQALAALREGDYPRFARLYRDEKGFVVRPYLLYHALRERLRHDAPAAVSAFLHRYPKLPVTHKLQIAWLHFLARRHRLALFRRFYTKALDTHVALHCDDLRARAQAGRNVASAVQRVWLTGASLPHACQALTAHWLKAGGATQANLWARAKRAMHDDNTHLAKRLERQLAPMHALWVRRWRAMQAHPAYRLDHLSYPLLARRARHIVRSGVLALGARSPTFAMAAWQQLVRAQPILARDQNFVMRRLGLIAAEDHLPQALPWLARAVPGHKGGQLRRWRVRAALRQRDWRAALRFLNGLPRANRHQHEWRYWRARALAELGQTRAADAVFARLARHFGYYGFLAADRIGRPYHIPNVPLAAPHARLAAVMHRKTIRMAHELFLLHQHREARALWFQALATASQRTREAAAVLAAHWGWRDCAILTLAGTHGVHALDIRFPLLYEPLIEADARRNGIDPAWVYGIIRQESAFIFDARSDVGALGLMQLMPQTGFIAAREIHLPLTGDRDLLDVANNLDIGTRYLADVLGRARHQEPVATAAYNAGPTAAVSWLPVKRPMPADIWIDTIPYQQTRRYVKNVLTFTAVYGYLLDRHADSLKNCMAPITPAVELAADGD